MNPPEIPLSNLPYLFTFLPIAKPGDKVIVDDGCGSKPSYRSGIPISLAIFRLSAKICFVLLIIDDPPPPSDLQRASFHLHLTVCIPDVYS